MVVFSSNMYCCFQGRWICLPVSERFCLVWRYPQCLINRKKKWHTANEGMDSYRSDLTDKMKRSFFLAAVVSILLYGCTTWTLTKEARRQLHKNAASNIEQVLAATPHKAPTIRPPASHHENYPSQTKQTCRTLLEKQGRAHKWCTPIDPHIWPGKSRTTSSNMHTAAMWGSRM